MNGSSGLISDKFCTFAMRKYFSFPPIIHLHQWVGGIFLLSTKVQNYQLFDEQIVINNLNIKIHALNRVHPRNRVIGFVLLPIRPVELGKTTNTTFTTCNNLHASCVAILLQGKQQNTTLRQDKMSGNVQGEALFIVVSLAATFDQNGPRRGNVPAKRCSKL